MSGRPRTKRLSFHHARKPRSKQSTRGISKNMSQQCSNRSSLLRPPLWKYLLRTLRIVRQCCFTLESPWGFACLNRIQEIIDIDPDRAKSLDIFSITLCAAREWEGLTVLHFLMLVSCSQFSTPTSRHSFFQLSNLVSLPKYSPNSAAMLRLRLRLLRLEEALEMVKLLRFFARLLAASLFASVLEFFLGIVIAVLTDCGRWDD